MAAAFTLLWLLVFSMFGVLFAAVLGRRRDGDPIGLALLAPTLAFGAACLYLVIKLVYEEFIPCVFIDQRYCSFGSTQYWNLFGWEF